MSFIKFYFLDFLSCKGFAFILRKPELLGFYSPCLTTVLSQVALQTANHPGLAFHCFPSDADLRKLWLTRIRRDDIAGQFQVTSSTRVCGNHFPPSAYFLAGQAGKRKRERKTERKSSRLVKGAAPSEFECFLEHLRPVVPKRKAPVERQPLLPKAKRLDVGRSVAAGADSDGDRADEPCTKHCHCVSSLVDKATELEDALEDERSAHALTSSLLKEATDKKSSPVFCLEKFAGNDKKIRYYTGFFTIGVFMACFHFLEKSAREMRCWAERRTRRRLALGVSCPWRISFS